MDDETNTHASTDSAAPAAIATQPAPFVVTPEVEAYANEKANKAAAAARREALAKKSEPQPKSKPAEHVEVAPVAARDQTFEDSLADALAEQKELTKDQRQLVRKLARLEQPGDVDDYVTRMAGTFGVTPKPNSTVTPTPAPANAAPSSPPRAASPAPSTVVPGDGPERVLTWSESQVADFSGKNGGNAANPMHWSNRAAAIKIAQLVEAEMAGMHFTARKR